MYTTNKHKSYWQNRKIDWKKDYFDTLDHPHRQVICYMLNSLPFFSLWEIGVGGGANLAKIIKELKRPMQLGGSDINQDAVDFCSKTFEGGLFHCESADDMMMSDKSVDVILSDMTLIYVDPLKIDKYIEEIKRVARTNIVFCEFHSTSWWKRLTAKRYYVYNYKKLLAKHGFYDIIVQPIPKEMWPGTDKYTEFRSIITARI